MTEYPPNTDDIDVYLTPVPVEGIDTTRIARALQAAHDAFWAAAVRHFPEVTSGDVDPGMSVQIEQQMGQFLANWLWTNHPDAPHD